MGKLKSPRTRMREYRERMKLHKDEKEAILCRNKLRRRLLREQETNLSLALKVHRNNLNRQRVAKYRISKKTAFEIEEKESPMYNPSRTFTKSVTGAT